MDSYCKRFVFVLDMNGDGMFTISDVGLLFKAAFLLPSSFVASMLHRYDATAQFFEIDCSSGRGLGGATFSFVAWLALLALLATAESRR